MCDWSSDVCSSDLDYCNRSHPVGVAVDCEGGARRNRKPPAQAGRECLANCTRTGVKEKIMTETIKLLRIYTDEAAYLGDRKVLEVIASRARDAGLAGKIGRAAGREGVCQYVLISVVAVLLKKKE